MTAGGGARREAGDGRTEVGLLRQSSDPVAPCCPTDALAQREEAGPLLPKMDTRRWRAVGGVGGRGRMPQRWEPRRASGQEEGGVR